jgi:hypothetical protein
MMNAYSEVLRKKIVEAVEREGCPRSKPPRPSALASPL